MNFSGRSGRQPDKTQVGIPTGDREKHESGTSDPDRLGHTTVMIVGPAMMFPPGRRFISGWNGSMNNRGGFTQ